VIAGCETLYFGMSVSDSYLAATVNAAAGDEEENCNLTRLNTISQRARSSKPCYMTRLFPSSLINANEFSLSN